jgi:hypothetical protein
LVVVVVVLMIKVGLEKQVAHLSEVSLFCYLASWYS